MIEPTFTRTVSIRSATWLVCALSLFAFGCLAEFRVIDERGGAGTGPDPDPAMPDGGAQGGDPMSEAGASGYDGSVMNPSCDPLLMPVGCDDPSSPSGVAPCAYGGVCREIAVTNIDKVDLLFVIDDSASMAEEQAALREQFPRLLTRLTTGDRDGDGAQDVPSVKDLHLAVVSSDMGAVGVADVVGCEGFGDDGVFNSTPSPEVTGCSASYPVFLTYTTGIHDVARSAVDLACLATLGTEGCGYEQPLEAALKALWPSTYIDPATGLMTRENPIWFLADASGQGTLGHGDRENTGFLRNDPTVGRSVLSVVVLADEDDCSSRSTAHMRPFEQLDASDPLLSQPPALRCFFNRDNLYPVQRYVAGLRALRPGHDQLVLFTAIAGVPADLVSAEVRGMVDASDPMLREAYYQRVLDDPRMQEVIDPSSNADVRLAPACQSATRVALPGRRLVETARQFGENGLVQSICEDDFGPALDAIADQIGARSGMPCLDVMLPRTIDGVVDCDVLWELPPANMAGPATPTHCGQPGFAFLVDAPDRMTVGGGAVCAAEQIGVTASGELARGGEGWYYDDFSQEAQTECAGDDLQRIAFTPSAKPPVGVRVYLDCRP